MVGCFRAILLFKFLFTFSKRRWSGIPTRWIEIWRFIYHWMCPFIWTRRSSSLIRGGRSTAAEKLTRFRSNLEGPTCSNCRCNGPCLFKKDIMRSWDVGNEWRAENLREPKSFGLYCVKTPLWLHISLYIDRFPKRTIINNSPLNYYYYLMQIVIFLFQIESVPSLDIIFNSGLLWSNYLIVRVQIDRYL